MEAYTVGLPSVHTVARAWQKKPPKYRDIEQILNFGAPVPNPIPFDQDPIPQI